MMPPPPANRIVVVDDDVVFVRVMGHHLTQQGYAVETFTAGPAALQALQQAPAAVLVTDIDMPIMSGLELLRAARQLDPHLEVIVVTAYGSMERAVAALREGGAYDFLTKPFESMYVLSLAVERACAHRALLLDRAVLTERLNAVLTHTGEALLCAEADGILRVANPAALRLLENENLVGQPALAVLPRSVGHLLANWQTLGQNQPLVVEVPGFSQSRWLVSLAPLPQNGWVMVIRDVTLLERLDEVRYQWLAEAASRMQMPLAQTVSDMAELSVLVGEQNKRAAGIIYRQTKTWDRVRAWADHAQLLMKIEAGVGLFATDIDLPTAITEIVRTAPDVVIRSKRLKVKLALAKELPKLRMDADLLRRAIHALLTWSAVRCQPDGKLELAVSQQADQILLEVRDDGPPLGQTDLAHLFERSLWNGDSEPGLELALVQAIAERMGGQVWATGQALVLCLPAARDEALED